MGNHVKVEKVEFPVYARGRGEPVFLYNEIQTIGVTVSGAREVISRVKVQ